MTHKRKVLLENGEYVEEPRFLTIDGKPGLPSGTRFVFDGEGNKTPKKGPGPVVFVLKPLPHNLFQRRGPDLIRRVTLPLYQVGQLISSMMRSYSSSNLEAVEPLVLWFAGTGSVRLNPNSDRCPTQALCGAAIDVPTLDNRTLSVPIADIVKPGFKTVVVGEGMPKPGGGKGDLILEVELLFPMGLTEPQKMLLKAAFFLPHTPSEKQVGASRCQQVVSRIATVPCSDLSHRAYPLSSQNHAVLAFEKAFKNPLEGWSKQMPKEPHPPK